MSLSLCTLQPDEPNSCRPTHTDIVHQHNQLTKANYNPHNFSVIKKNQSSQSLWVDQVYAFSICGVRLFSSNFQPYQFVLFFYRSIFYFFFLSSKIFRCATKGCTHAYTSFGRQNGKKSGSGFATCVWRGLAKQQMPILIRLCASRWRTDEASEPNQTRG